MRWVRLKSEAQSRETRRKREFGRPRSDSARCGTDVACDVIWPHPEASTHTVSLSQPGLGAACLRVTAKAEGPSTVASPTTLFAHKCHLSPQTFVCQSFVSILVSFCLWFDIVNVGVIGRCAFSQVLSQYWLAVICYWLPLPWCQVTRFYHLSSRLCLAVWRICRECYHEGEGAVWHFMIIDFVYS